MKLDGKAADDFVDILQKLSNMNEDCSVIEEHICSTELQTVHPLRKLGP